MNNIRIFFFLAVYGITGCGSTPDMSKIVVPVMQDTIPLSAFHLEHQRWPSGLPEFYGFCSEHGIQPAMAAYSNVVFQTQSNGSLRVEYDVATACSGPTQFTLNPPSVSTNMVPTGVERLKADAEKAMQQLMESPGQEAQQSPPGDRLKAPPEE